MKRFLAAGIVALALLGSVQQSASAWCSCRFSIGFNCEFSCGSNCCGLWRCGPPPDCCGPLYGWYAPAPPPAYAFQAAPAGYATGASAAPSYGYPASNGYQFANYPQGYPANYYLMGYPGAANPYAGGAINFYGN